jgi:hypothetical protein
MKHPNRTRPARPDDHITRQSFSDCLDLMIAAEMARLYRLNVAAKIKKVARRIRDRTQDPAMFELCKLTTKAPDGRVMDSINRLHDEFVRDGIL